MVAEEALEGRLGDMGADVIGELLAVDQPRLSPELNLDVPYPLIVDEEVEEVEAVVVGDGAAFADDEEVGPEVIILITEVIGSGVEEVVLLLAHHHRLEEERDGRDQYRGRLLLHDLPGHRRRFLNDLLDRRFDDGRGHLFFLDHHRLFDDGRRCLLDLHNDRLINSNGLFNNNFWEYFDSYDRSFKRFLHDGRNIHQLRFFWNDRNFG